MKHGDRCSFCYHSNEFKVNDLIQYSGRISAFLSFFFSSTKGVNNIARREMNVSYSYMWYRWNREGPRIPKMPHVNFQKVDVTMETTSKGQ